MDRSEDKNIADEHDDGDKGGRDDAHAETTLNKQHLAKEGEELKAEKKNSKDESEDLSSLDEIDRFNAERKKIIGEDLFSFDSFTDS